MKKRFLKIVIGIVLVCILFVGFLYANNNIGMTSTNLETDIRSSPIEKIAYFMKLVGWEQLATQSVPRWQVHKRVAGCSQRRGSVASPV